MSDETNTPIVKFPYAVKLLERAAQSLQELADRDVNDPLAVEINTFLTETQQEAPHATDPTASK